MVIFLEIESYEPYHIGNKLNPATNFEALKDKLKEKLGEIGYELSKENFQGFTPSVEVLGKKENVKIELNNSAQALNVIGNSPEEVTQHYSELISILNNLGFEREDTIIFTEIITTPVIKSDGKPIAFLSDLFKKDPNSIAFKDIDGLDVIGIRLAEKNTKEEIFNVAIEPSPTSKSTRFKMRLHYRPQNSERIISFYENLNEDIINLIKQLG